MKLTNRKASYLFFTGAVLFVFGIRAGEEALVALVSISGIVAMIFAATKFRLFYTD